MKDAQAGPSPIWTRIWDAPTRLFHWLLVILMGVSWYTAEKHHMEIHRWSGYAVLGLILFRIYWGLVGSETARFSGFVKGPKRTLAYLRTLPGRAASHTVGHNPVGAVSVVAILLAVAAQVIFGLFAVDIDGLESGPLSYMVSFDTGRLFAKLHGWSFNVLLVLAGIHIAAVLFYLFYKRENLIRPMVTGRRRFDTTPAAPRMAPLWLALIGVVIAAGMVWFVMQGLKPSLLLGH